MVIRICGGGGIQFWQIWGRLINSWQSFHYFYHDFSEILTAPLDLNGYRG